ncbi:MAG: TonB-dependent receptor [Bacteroidota bacterium]
MKARPTVLASRHVLFPLLAAAVALASGPRAARAQSSEGLGMPRPEAPSDGKQVEAKKLTKVPKQIKSVAADYPKEALEKGITADVVLLLDINAEGKVDTVGIAEPATPPGLGFDEAAMIAAQQFEFEPAEMDGKRIPVQISYRYRFTLAAPKPPEPAPPSPQPQPDAGATPAAAQPAAPPAAAPAPVLNFAGLLRERGTRLPLAGVLVTVFRDDGAKAVGYEATSTADGAFQFFDLTPGDWKVLIEPPGFYPYRTTETIKAGERIDTTYFVERGSYNPYDVTVTATRPRKEVSRTVITAQELDKIPGTFGDPLAVIQNFAGVARPPPFSGLLIIRGSAPEDTRFFTDGAEIPLVYHFGGLRTVFPVGIIDSIAFYPGNFSPMYGRAIGGIVDVQIKKLQPKKLGGYVDINLFDSGAFLEVPLGNKGGIALAGRRSYIDYLLKAAVPDNAPVNLITAPRYYDYQLVANYRPAPAHDIRAMLFGSDDRLELLFRNPGALTAQISNNSLGFSTTFYRSMLTYNFVPNDRWENSFKISQGRNWIDVGFGQLQFHLNTYVSQIRDTVRFKVGDWLTLVGGADVQFSQTDVFVRLPLPPREGQPQDMNGPPDLSNILTTDRKGIKLWSPAAFVEAEFKPVPGLLLLPGLRADYFDSVSQGSWQPRATARWAASDKWTAKGGAGLFVQEPTPDQTDPVFGNTALKLERSLHLSMGTEYKPRPQITLDATLFYKHMYDLVSGTDEQVMDANGMARRLNYKNTGSGKAYGIELVARHEFTNKFAGWLAYTLSRATRHDDGATADRLFDYDQTHILTMVGSYMLPRNWQIGGRFRLVSGNPVTPVTGAVYNASVDRYLPTYGQVNSARLPLFHQLDVRLDKRWVYQRWMLNLYLDVQNIYNHVNADNYDYNFNFRKSNPQQGLPILTILGIKAEF